MDTATLTIILKELQADCAVGQDAAHKAACRVQETTTGHFEACAYALARIAEEVAAELPAWCAEFGCKVRAERRWHT